jgi:hypothetical protein
MIFTHKKGDKYVVTGYYHNSTKKFQTTYHNPYYALAINLWNGQVWQCRGGKKRLIKEVVN